MIRTALTDLLGIEHPVIQAGMGGVAGSRLTAAVSNAGGLGVLGAAMMSPRAVRDEIRWIKAHTERPYGVDLLLAEGTPMIDELMAVLFEEEVPVFVSGLGDPGRWVEPMHAAGMKVVALVGNVRQAQRCARSGVDLVVAQGHEAGGHTGRVPTMVLVPLVVDAVAPIPVAAAGGVGDGRGLAAALMLGAQGVLAGTRFIATAEAACHDAYKAKLEELDEEGTLVTRSYTGKPCRVVRNRHTEEWARREAEVQPFPLQLLSVGERAGAAIATGDMEYGMAPAGQVAGMIHDRPSAAEVVERLVAEAETLLRAASSRWLDGAAPAPRRNDGEEESDMRSGIEIVEAFVEAFNRKDMEAIMSFFTDDAVYHNMPTDAVRGKDAVRKAIEAYVPISDSIEWDIVYAAQTGDTVLTERIDRFMIGGKSVVLPVMGAFDLRDGKIESWRDYFDMATWGRQMAGRAE